MAEPRQSLRSRLIVVLERSDEMQREARADRILWMSQHIDRPGIIFGADEALGILSEAESAFREGHFISVILLAFAYVEHELTDTLIRKSLANFGVTLQQAIDLARKHQVLDAPLIERIDQLRQIRNPFTHLKRPEHQYSFGNRFRSQGAHPQALLEEDAKEAFEIMYQVFRALLRIVA